MLLRNLGYIQKTKLRIHELEVATITVKGTDTLFTETENYTYRNKFISKYQVPLELQTDMIRKELLHDTL